MNDKWTLNKRRYYWLWFIKPSELSFILWETFLSSFITANNPFEYLLPLTLELQPTYLVLGHHGTQTSQLTSRLLGNYTRSHLVLRPSGRFPWWSVAPCLQSVGGNEETDVFIKERMVNNRFFVHLHYCLYATAWPAGHEGNDFTAPRQAYNKSRKAITFKATKVPHTHFLN